jgi:hypothetical protein
MKDEGAVFFFAFSFYCFEMMDIKKITTVIINTVDNNITETYIYGYIRMSSSSGTILAAEERDAIIQVPLFFTAVGGDLSSHTTLTTSSLVRRSSSARTRRWLQNSAAAWRAR